MYGPHLGLPVNLLVNLPQLHGPPADQQVKVPQHHGSHHGPLQNQQRQFGSALGLHLKALVNLQVNPLPLVG